MSVSGVYGIGGNGSNLFQVNGPSTRNSGTFSLKPASGPQSGPDPTIDQLRAQLLAASGALGDTFRDFTTGSNGSEVAANVSAAADKLNEVLSQLGTVRDSLSLRNELETTMQSAIDSLRGAGAQGLSWNAADGELRVTVDPHKLAGSLTALLGGQDENGLGTAIEGLLDGFTRQTATFAAPRVPEPPKPDPTLSEARDALKAQLADNPISPLLLLKKSSFQTDAPTASTFKKAAEAYGEQKHVSGPEIQPRSGAKL